MAKRRGGGLLGLFAFIIVVLLIIAYLQKHNFHLPDLGSHSGNGSLPTHQPVFHSQPPDILQFAATAQPRA